MTAEVAKLFLKKALGNQDNLPPHVFALYGLRSYPAAIRELQSEGQFHRCRERTRRYCNNRGWPSLLSSHCFTFADLCLRFLLIAAAHKHLIPNDIT